MARKRLKLQYITDDNQRKQSFKNRKKGITKKLDEIRILCGVDACAIIYDQFNPNPEVWPSNSEVNNVIERFEKLSLKNQTTRSVSQQEFLMQHIAKVERKTKKLIEENHEACMREAMFKYLGGEMNDFQMSDGDRLELCKYIDQYLKDLIYHKKITLQNSHFETGESFSMAMAATNMVPIPFMAQTTMREASRPSPYFESGESSSMAMVPTNMMSQAIVATNMAPTPVPPFMAPTTMREASRPSQYFETGESSSMAMVPNMMSQGIVATNMAPIPVPSFMAPTTMGEASSSKSPQLNNELQCIVSSNLPANSLATNLLFNNNQELYPYMNQSMIPSYQGSEHFGFQEPNNNQEGYIPVMGQDEFYNPNQNENHQNGIVNEMMGLAEQTDFPWMEDNHRYNNQN